MSLGIGSIVGEAFQAYGQVIAGIESAAEKEHRLNAPHEAAARAVRSALGEVRVEAEKMRVRVTWGHVEGVTGSSQTRLTRWRRYSRSARW